MGNIFDSKSENNDLINGAFGKRVEKVLTDVEREGLTGHVKRITQKHYKAFERDGNVYLAGLQGQHYEDKNKATTYNEEGRAIENVSNSFDGHSYYTSYTEAGRTKEVISYSPEGAIMQRHTFEYNDDGDCSESVTYIGKEEVATRSVYTYWQKGKELKVETSDKDGALTQRRSSIYDKNGLRVELKMTNEKGVLVFWSKHKYNSKGHLVETTSHNAEGAVSYRNSMYHCYDAAGDPIVGKPSVKKKDKYTANVEKDTHGNWTKKMLCYRGKAAFVYTREIEYFDEAFVATETVANDYFNLPLLIKNLSTAPVSEKDIESMPTNDMASDSPISLDEAKWVTERSKDHENFSYWAYYVIKNNEFPSINTHKESNIEVRALLKVLEEDLEAKIINSVKTTDIDGFTMMERYTVVFPEHSGYMVHVPHISKYDSENYETPPFLEDLDDYDNETIHLGEVVILQPSDASGRNDENDILDSIKECIERCMVEEVEDTPRIYMVQASQNNTFMLQSHPAKDDFEIDDLDVQYGYGFEKFHDSLMDRFKHESQGLVLFHGLPGTGKTYYIRHLLREMAISKKIVIYMPPNMVDHLVEPSFMTFLSLTVKSYSASGQFCVLLIEDAEPLLASRNTNGRIQGVTNLLNMTDGLLNDMLKLQIICTFNVDLKELDAALLRPGRLIARKEFKALPELDANLLAQSLGIKHVFKAPATLSEIYAMLKNKSTLIHDEY